MYRHINILTEILLERLMQKTGQLPFVTGLSEYLIATASALHDIGKIGIDEKILNKPGQSDASEEFEIMKTHTRDRSSHSEAALSCYQNEPTCTRCAYQICRWHHERYDGKRLPGWLEGRRYPDCGTGGLHWQMCTTRW